MTLHQLELRSASCDYAGGYFRLNDKGLSFIGSDKDGNQLQYSNLILNMGFVIDWRVRTRQ